jgi:hypothetical protein
MEPTNLITKSADRNSATPGFQALSLDLTILGASLAVLEAIVSGKLKV